VPSEGESALGALVAGGRRGVAPEARQAPNSLGSCPREKSPPSDGTARRAS
jgi:hypothetical protein